MLGRAEYVLLQNYHPQISWYGHRIKKETWHDQTNIITRTNLWADRGEGSLSIRRRALYLWLLLPPPALLIIIINHQQYVDNNEWELDGNRSDLTAQKMMHRTRQRTRSPMMMKRPTLEVVTSTSSSSSDFAASSAWPRSLFSVLGKQFPPHLSYCWFY